MDELLQFSLEPIGNSLEIPDQGVKNYNKARIMLLCWSLCWRKSSDLVCFGLNTRKSGEGGGFGAHEGLSTHAVLPASLALYAYLWWTGRGRRCDVG